MEEKIRILCVDDEVNVLKALERSLEAEDCEILTASSGLEGLSVLRAVSPVHVVISDYRMPGMSGVEFLREVCREWPDTVRIVLLAYADSESIIYYVNEGHIYRFISKPWVDTELKNSISSALELYFLNRKNILLSNELLLKIEELKQANFQLGILRTGEKTLQDSASANINEIVLDSLPAGVVSMDSKGSVILCNREAQNIFQCRKTEYGDEDIMILPRAISDFIARPRGREPLTGKVLLYGEPLRITVVFPDDPGKPAVIFMIERDRL